MLHFIKLTEVLSTDAAQEMCKKKKKEKEKKERRSLGFVFCFVFFFCFVFNYLLGKTLTNGQSSRILIFSSRRLS